MTITADCGGGNRPRVHLWKVELQRLADETGLELELCQFPPGTSKWNKVEHCLFSFISLNWRGRPLTNYQRILDLISSTTTSTGLKVYARLDDRLHQGQSHQGADRGRQDHRARVAPEWNYRISSSTRSP